MCSWYHLGLPRPCGKAASAGTDALSVAIARIPLPLVTGGIPAHPTGIHGSTPAFVQAAAGCGYSRGVPTCLAPSGSSLVESKNARHAPTRYSFAVIAFSYIICSIAKETPVVKRQMRSDACRRFAAKKASTFENRNSLGIFCGEKFTKYSLHSQRAGCIMVAIYWMDYAPKKRTVSGSRGK